MRTRRWRWAVTTSLIATILFPSSAHASSHCYLAGEETLFWGNRTAGSNPYFPLTSGTRSLIRNTLRYIDPGYAYPCRMTHSTSHVALAGAYGNWVETGWREVRGTNGTYFYVPFTEWGLGFEHIAYHEHSAPCTLIPGSGSAYWLVDNGLGTNAWRMSVNCNGTTFYFLQQYDTGTAVGHALAETGRFTIATNPIAVTDLHSGLIYKTTSSSPSWPAWTNDACYADLLGGWKGNRISANSHSVVLGDQTCYPA